MIQKFRKKPVIVEMVQWTGKNKHEIIDFVGKELESSAPPSNYEHDHDITNELVKIFIPSREGDMTAIRTDWVVKGYSTEFGIHFWVVADSYKKDAYELIEDQKTDWLSLYKISDEQKQNHVSGRNY